MISNMTTGTITYKMFKANFKKYSLFVVCNTVVIAILFSVVSLIFNEQFMDPLIVDQMISSKIYVSVIILTPFALLFLPYTQNAFLKSREKEYGILLVLGLTERDVRKNLLLEQSVLCLIFLVGGLLLGTILSFAFLTVVSSIIRIPDLEFQLSPSLYGVIIFFVVSVYAITVLINLITIIRRTIVEKLKASEKTEATGHARLKYCFCGLMLTIAAFILMILIHHIDNNIELISLPLAAIGSVLLFYNGEAIIEWFRRRYRQRYIRSLFNYSDLRYYYGKNKRIFLANTWIFFTILFFSAFGLFTYSSFTTNALVYQPFHLSYTEDIVFKPLDEDTVRDIVSKYDNRITLSEKVEFARIDMISVFCVDDINRVLNTDYVVPDNSYIHVYRYYLQDGYQHDLTLHFSSIDIDMNDGSTKKLEMLQDIVSPLIGQIHSITNEILLVSENDFKQILQYRSPSTRLVTGTLHFYNFENWRNSAPIAKEVQDKLIAINGAIDDRYHKIYSRIETYDTAEKSAQLLNFTVLYVSALLYASAILMVHFKLGMERDNDLKKFHLLHRIGITDKEISKIISSKHTVVFLIPLAYSIIITILFNYFIFKSYGLGAVITGYSCICSVVLICLHILLCKIYSYRSCATTTLVTLGR